MLSRSLVFFTKPAQPGRVKTRLIGDLDAEQAAQLHGAFRDDLLERLAPGAFEVTIAWALEEGETPPELGLPATRQEGDDLGERLFRALERASRAADAVAAVGSDHPLLDPFAVEEGFERLEAGAEVVLGPASDGGYYLIAVRAAALDRRLFERIPWSSAGVLAATLERCSELGLAVELLPEAADVDTADDLRDLTQALAESDAEECPRTRQLLAGWGRLRENR